MAIGRSFEEAIQKGIRMVGVGMHGFVGNKDEMVITDIDEELMNPTGQTVFLPSPKPAQWLFRRKDLGT